MASNALVHPDEATNTRQEPPLNRTDEVKEVPTSFQMPFFIANFFTYLMEFKN